MPERVNRGSEAGQSVVEFALVLPILLLVLLGIIDFGRVLSTGYVVSHAARDAARYASVGASDPTISQVVASETSSVPGNVTWAVSPPNGAVSGQAIEVTVSAPVQIFDPVLAAILGTVYTSTASVSFRVE